MGEGAIVKRGFLTYKVTLRQGGYLFYLLMKPINFSISGVSPSRRVSRREENGTCDIDVTFQID